jgi:hypothetical protein
MILLGDGGRWIQAKQDAAAISIDHGAWDEDPWCIEGDKVDPKIKRMRIAVCKVGEIQDKVKAAAE